MPEALTEAQRAQMHEEVFTNEGELFWLTTESRTLFEAVSIVADDCDPDIGSLEVRKVRGCVEPTGDRELHFSRKEGGDVEVWEIEVSDDDQLR